MKLDFQQVAAAHRAGIERRLADVHGLLETRQILLCQIQLGLREHGVNELRRDVERQRPRVVIHRRRSHGRLVLGRLQTVLPLLAPLEQVADTQVELGAVVHVVAR